MPFTASASATVAARGARSGITPVASTSVSGTLGAARWRRAGAGGGTSRESDRDTGATRAAWISLAPSPRPATDPSAHDAPNTDSVNSASDPTRSNSETGVRCSFPTLPNPSRPGHGDALGVLRGNRKMLAETPRVAFRRLGACLGEQLDDYRPRGAFHPRPSKWARTAGPASVRPSAASTKAVT